MKPQLTCLLTALLPWAAIAEPARPYVNDKKAPENRQDLDAIQHALTQVLPAARNATVCIELGEGSGSGVIVSEDGLVLTAAHVTSGVNKDLTVVLEDGRRLKAVSLGVVADTDAAMVRITDKEKFPFVEIERKETTRLGDWVFALGHAGGFDKERGSVVRLGRLVRTTDTTIQSDCTLIGGDSGGPLFNLQGQLIGIHSRIGVWMGIDMHVPIQVFVKNWEGLLKAEFIGEGPFVKKPEKGKGFLGLATEARSEGGLTVTKVGKDTPAAKAEFKDGDVLLKLNGSELKTREQLQDLLKDMAAGDPLEFETLRAAKPLTIKLKLGAR